LGFNGKNHLQHYIDGKTVDVCPNSGCTLNRSTHIIFCHSPDHGAVFSSSVDKLVEWLSYQRTDPELTVLLSHYLRAQGRASMLSFSSPFSRYRELATVVDELGFHNMLEGSIRCSSLSRDNSISFDEASGSMPVIGAMG
jgi:hypothetical protein